MFFKKQKYKYFMQKKGEAVSIIALTSFLIVITGIVTATYLSIDEQHQKYVGDISSRRYYDISCLSKINPENRVLFESRKVAEDFKFVFSEC